MRSARCDAEASVVVTMKSEWADAGLPGAIAQPRTLYLFSSLVEVALSTFNQSRIA